MREEIAAGIVADRDVDADGAQHRLDQHLRFGVLLMTGGCVDGQMHRERALMEDAVRARRPSGAREQPARVCRVVAVGRKRRRRPRLRKDVRDRELVDAVKDRILDALPIDGLGDRAADAHVGKLRTAHVDAEMPPAPRSGGDRRVMPGDAREARDRVGVTFGYTSTSCGDELVEERVDVRNDFPNDFLEFRRAAKVARVRDEVRATNRDSTP